MSPVICEALAVKEDRRIRTKIPPSTSSQGNTKADSGAMDIDGADDAPKQFLANEIAPSSSHVK